jgi:hypothetical protein
VAKKAPGADQCTEAFDHIDILQILPGSHSPATRALVTRMAKRAIFP